jgi:hypothetical protein
LCFRHFSVTKDLSEACDIKHHHLASKLRHG